MSQAQFSSTKKKRHNFFNTNDRDGDWTPREVTLYIPAFLGCITLLYIGLGSDTPSKRLSLPVHLTESAIIWIVLYASVTLYELWLSKHDTGVDAEPEQVESSESIWSCSSVPGLSKHRTCAVQTEAKNFKFMSQMARQRHDREVRKITRDMRMMRKKIAEKFRKIKKEISQKDEEITKLQLLFPSLLKHREILLAEEDAIDKQLAEENMRSEKIAEKFQKLHSKLEEFGNNSTLFGLSEFTVMHSLLENSSGNNNNNNNACAISISIQNAEDQTDGGDIQDSAVYGDRDGSIQESALESNVSTESEFWMDDNVTDVSNFFHHDNNEISGYTNFMSE